MNRRAIILAGGLGTRLQPYTAVFPKPLLPVGSEPILAVVVRQLARQGFDRITMAVNHKASLIRAFFGDGHTWGTSIDYSQEQGRAGTMGPLRMIRDLPAQFLVLNGDVLTDLSFRAFHDEHVRSEALFTVSAKKRNEKIDFGMLELGPRHRLAAFREKPVVNYLVSMGVYMVSRKICQEIPAGRPYGFDDLMTKCLKKRIPVKVRIHRGLWLDIGRPADYLLAQNFVKKIR